METARDNGPREETLAEVVNRLAGNFAQLVQYEIELAKEELREYGKAVVTAVIMIVTGALLALYGLFFLFFGGVFGLAAALPTWAASLIVGGGLTLVALLLILPAFRRLSRVKPLQKTSKTMRENVEWLKHKRA
ncbi:MAG: phage holin family protein [Candidatus Aquicultorales bacterium]